MTLRLNGSTSGSVSLDAPATGSNVSLELPTDSIKPGLVLVAAQSFSAASTVSVNNCFSATYDNYRILWTGTNAGFANMNLRWRVSGADSSAANYSYTTGYVSGSGTFGNSAANTAGTSLIFAGLGNNTGSTATLDVFDPFKVSGTYAIYDGQYRQPDPLQVRIFGSHFFTSAVSFDGFSIYPASGTITGSIRIYGYRNSL